MQLVGTISGEVSPHKFSIQLTVSTVEKGSYVQIRHEQYGWVLAKIEDMKRYLDARGDEVVMASARTIGYKEGPSILIPKTPFKPDEKVYLADTDLIIDVIGVNRSRKDSFYLGFLEGHRIPVYLDMDKTIRKHISVLAKTGAGKSYTVAVIIEELLKNDYPMIILDPHGEYHSLKYENEDYDAMMLYDVKPKSYEDRIVEYASNVAVNPQAKKFTLRPKFTFDELVDIMPTKLGDKQKAILYNALSTFDNQEYTIPELIEEVEMDKSDSKWKVISGLEAIRNSGIFEGEPLMDRDLVKEGQATIVNLKGSEPRIQETIVAKICTDLFNAKKVGSIPNFLLLVEEAHNFCPERSFGDALSSQILRTIASEGRKFGFNLCVVSQRPARIDKNILSQCNTQIILKVTNPNDLRAISQSIEGFTPGMENDIKQLSVGQAIVVGECVEQPITVNIRARETRHGLSRERREKGEKEKDIERRRALEKIKTSVGDKEKYAPTPAPTEKKHQPTAPKHKPVEKKSRLSRFSKRIKNIFLEDA